MAGRPKKKPEYNPELQFNNFLQELRDAYEEADSLRSLADELNISLLKLRKLLITADVFTSDICTEINDLHQSGKKIPEIMKLTGLSRASVHSYLPYTKGLYNAAEISLNAERCRTYKIRQEQVRLLKEIPSEENLWQAVIAFQDYPLKTATGLPFRYKLIQRQQRKGIPTIINGVHIIPEELYLNIKSPNILFINLYVDSEAALWKRLKIRDPQKYKPDRIPLLYKTNTDLNNSLYHIPGNLYNVYSIDVSNMTVTDTLSTIDKIFYDIYKIS